MKKDKLVNIEGCFRCKKLIGDLRSENKTHMSDGYEQCECGADIDLFWLNLTTMKFQESRPVNIQKSKELANFFWQSQ
jgi:hypothetical protein